MMNKRCLPFWLALMATSGCLAPNLLSQPQPAATAKPTASPTALPSVSTVALPNAVPTAVPSSLPSPESDLAIVSVIAISNSPTEQSDMQAGDTLAVTATATYDDDEAETDPDEFDWSSTDTLVATVSSTGLVTAVRFGVATIKAQIGGIVGTTLVTVAPTVSLLAGGALVGDYVNDNTGANVRFNGPSGGVVMDDLLYVADTGNHAIRQVASSGLTTTFAGAAVAAGNGYVNDTGTNARFESPVAIAKDSSGNLYVADRGNHAIRKVSAAGVVTTFAGADDTVLAAERDDLVDALGTEARFNSPSGIVADASGNLYVCDRDNHSVRKITAAGEVTVLAGADSTVDPLERDDYVNGTGTEARFSSPTGIAIDGAGNLYVADTGNHAIRLVTPAGVVTTFVGADSSVAVADRDGFANGFTTSARFNNPVQLVVDADDNLYVCDRDNHAIRKVSAGGEVTLFAGSGAAASGSTDGTTDVALFNGPEGLAITSGGALYVIEALNHLVRLIK